MICIMKLLLSIFILIPSLWFSQQNLEWSRQNRLSFDDFKGEIGISTAAAVSSVSIKFKILSQSIWTGRIKVKIYADFDQLSSWVKPEYKTLQLLAHEQGHFDIAEIFAKKLQKKIDVEIKGSQDFIEKFQKTYDDMYKEHLEFQDKYEIDTDMGRDFKKQEEYSKLIKEMLY